MCKRYFAPAQNGSASIAEGVQWSKDRVLAIILHTNPRSFSSLPLLDRAILRRTISAWGGYVGELVKFLNELIWSQALILLCLGAGLYFTIRTRCMQVRGLFEMIRVIVRGSSSAAGISPFQALAMSLSGRIGMGNIAGVATAITAGGPGAVFWMWVVALLGASTSYVECTLAQIYKERDDRGQYRGGPAY